VQTAPFAAVGRRIGAAVIGLAIVVPAALPLADDALTKGAGGLFGNDGKGSGNNRLTTIDPLVSLVKDFFRSEDLPVMTVTSDATSGSDLYMRMATLDQFDGTQWRRSTTGLPALTTSRGGRLDRRSRAADRPQRDQDDEKHRVVVPPVPYPLTDINISEAPGGSTSILRTS
jgi:hypothetical protein